LATVSCPHCHQLVDSQAISCPYCRTTLKAYGHPGIPLHRATGDGYLCDTCTYHADDTCNFPQRPYAKDCTLYQNIEETKLELEQQRYTNSFAVTVKSWGKTQSGFAVAIRFIISLFFVRDIKTLIGFLWGVGHRGDEGDRGNYLTSFLPNAPCPMP
jgi:hypothetical protein